MATGMPKRPQTAYFHYLNSMRETTKAEFPELKLGALQKVLAERWSALSDEERQRFKDLEAADRARYEAEITRLRESGDLERLEREAAEAAAAARAAAAAKVGEGDDLISATTVFPLARVKRIVKSDPDVKNVARDALAVIAKATEMFVADLSASAVRVAAQSKRKVVGTPDLVRGMRGNPAAEFLWDDFPLDLLSAVSTGAGGSAGGSAGAGASATGRSVRGVSEDDGDGNGNGASLQSSTSAQADGSARGGKRSRTVEAANAPSSNPILNAFLRGASRASTTTAAARASDPVLLDADETEQDREGSGEGSGGGSGGGSGEGSGEGSGGGVESRSGAGEPDTTGGVAAATSLASGDGEGDSDAR